MFTPTGRSEDILRGLRRTVDVEDPVFVEVGSVRGPTDAARLSDGWATLTLLEWAAANGGVVHTVDVRPRMGVIRTVVGDLFERLRVHACDVVDWDSWPERVTAIYLDGPNQPEPHLRATQKAVSLGCTVAIFDDVVREDYGPKATTAIPYLLELGWVISHRGERVVVMVEGAAL